MGGLDLSAKLCLFLGPHSALQCPPRGKEVADLKPFHCARTEVIADAGVLGPNISEGIPKIHGAQLVGSFGEGIQGVKGAGQPV